MPEQAMFAKDLAATDAIGLAQWERRALPLRIDE
jgi:hypothetical protein